MASRSGLPPTAVALDPASFALELLTVASLEVSAVMKVRHQRPYEDLAKLFTHPISRRRL